MTPRGPLRSEPRVLITREPGKWPRVSRALTERGVVPEFIATIRVVPPRDPEASRRAVESLESYSWIVLTSANGARALAERCRVAGRAATPFPRIAVVGEATGGAARAEGLPVDLVAESASGALLAAEMRSHLRRGDRILWVRPEIAAGDFDRALAAPEEVAVEGVEFYATVPADLAREAADRAASGAYAAIVITSPSSLRALLGGASDPEATRTALRAMRRIAIGATTAAAMEGERLPPDAIARHPGEEEIARLILSLLGS